MNNWIIIIALVSAGLLLMVAAVVVLLRLSKMKDTELRNSGKMELKVQALKIIMPLKVQAYERFLLYLERVQLPQLVKRVYTPGASPHRCGPGYRTREPSCSGRGGRK